MIHIIIKVPDEHWSEFYTGFAEVYPPDGDWSGTELEWVEYAMARDALAAAKEGKLSQARRLASELADAAVVVPPKKKK